MLMQNFKSAADLEITEPQKEALMKTLVLLETGKLVHVSEDHHVNEPATKFTGHFNMQRWAWDTECGSVCCIGGTAELIGNVVFDQIYGSKLYNLFYPQTDIDYGSITTAQAARALRSYLTTGDAKWAEAIAR